MVEVAQAALVLFIGIGCSIAPKKRQWMFNSPRGASMIPSVIRILTFLDLLLAKQYFLWGE